MPIRYYLFGLLCLPLISTAASAQDGPFIDEVDNTVRHDLEEKEWREGDFKLPDGYAEQDLQEFEVENSSGKFRYLIDASSLQTSEDGVTRFVLVIRSIKGVDNGSYEGIRCGEREYRSYAYGDQQGFKAIPGSKWRHISKSGAENYRNVLYSGLICDTNTGKANPTDVALRAMQHNRKAQSSLFFND